MEKNEHFRHLNLYHLFQSESYSVIILDLDFNITSWNAAAGHMYGWNAVEVINKSIFNVTEMTYLHSSQDKVVQTLFKTGYWSGEVIQKHKNGKNIHLIISFSVLTNENGNPIGTLAINHDLAYLNKKEIELARFANFPSENPHPVFRINHNGSISYANPAAQVLLYKAQSDERQLLLNKFEQYTKKTLDSGLFETFEITLDDLIFSFEISPIPESSYVNIYGRDITTQVKAETELKRSNLSLRERVKELTCLYNAIQVMETSNSLDELGPRIIELLVPAMQFPETAVPVLEIEDKTFAHNRFDNNLTHNIHSDIVLDSEKVGQLSVYYTINLPFLLPEEQNLLNALTNNLKEWLHNNRLQDKILEYSRNLEHLVNVRTQELEESERRIRTLYRGIPIPTLTWQKQAEDFILIDYNEVNSVVTNGQINNYLGVTASSFFKQNPDILEDLWHCYTEQVTIKRERHYTLVTTGKSRFFLLTFGFIAPDLIILHAEDFTDRKRLENKLRVSEERYRNLFLVAREGILIADSSGNIITANPAAARILGYNSTESLEGSSIPDMYYDAHHRRIFMNQLIQEGYLDNFEVKIKRKDGSIADILASSIIRKNRNGVITQIETIFTDISTRKQEERDMRRQLMKFQLDEGQLYFIQDQMPIMAQEAFRDLLNVGYQGIVVSRSNEKDIRQLINGSFNYCRLTEAGKEKLSPDTTTLHQLFMGYPRNTVFLVDCLDYLSIKNGFNQVLQFICWLKDLTIMNGNIGIIVGDPEFFSKKEIHAFKKEMQPVIVRNPEIPADLLEILQFIHRQNGYGVQPKYADIQRFLGISKPTTSKRIQQLIENGYVQEFARGSRKCLQISYSGMQLVSR